MKTRLKKNNIFFDNADWVVDEVKKEIAAGLRLLKEAHQPLASYFGSHNLGPSNKYYQHAEKVASELAKHNFGAVTGGGSGIAFAASEGARKAGMQSFALKSELLKQGRVEDIVFTRSMSFYFIFARRFLLSIRSEALIFYPGGYATLTELYEYLMLMQAEIVDPLPVICVDKAYWQGAFDWLEASAAIEGVALEKRGLNLVTIVDTVDEVVNLAKV